MWILYPGRIGILSVGFFFLEENQEKKNKKKKTTLGQGKNEQKINPPMALSWNGTLASLVGGK